MTVVRPRTRTGTIAMLAAAMAAMGTSPAKMTADAAHQAEVMTRAWRQHMGKLNNQHYCARYLNKKRGSMNKGIR